MKRTAIVVLSLSLGLLAATAASGATTNVALGAAVQLQGGPFFTGGWGGGWTVPAATVVDGVVLPRNTAWDLGPVWWDSRDLADRSITIDLGAAHRIDSFILQADNNDGYGIYYRTPGSATWELAWTVLPVCCWGMETRPNPNDATQRFVLPTPITADALMIVGDLDHGDRLFAVAEIAAFGSRLLSIDIKPGSDPNCFHLDGHGAIPVALLGGADFDVARVDISSLAFAGLAVRVRGNRGPLCSLELANGDDFLDLVCHFEDDPSAWQAGDDTACVSGNLRAEYGGGAILGCDSICVVP